MKLDLDAIEREVDSTFSEWDQLSPRTKDVVYALLDRARALDAIRQDARALASAIENRTTTTTWAHLDQLARAVNDALERLDDAT